MSVESLQILIEAIDQASAPIRQIQEQVERLQNTGRQLQQVGSNISRMGQGLTTGVSLPIVAGLGAAAYAAINFESSMADVRKVLGLNESQAQAMGQEILAMSRTLPISADGLAAIATSGGQLGIASDQILEFTQLTAKMATAFDMSAAQAGNAIARMMNVYSADMAEVSQIGDVVNRLSDTSAATSGDIVEAMTRIGGATRTFGLSANQSAALASAFISLGDAPEVAATAINGFLPMLQTATHQTPKFQEALESVGISATEMEAAVKQDAMGGIQMFLKALQGMDDPAKRAAAIQGMFGLGADSRALLKLANDASVLDKALATTEEAMASAGNSMEDEFANRAATTANQLQLLKNNLTEAAVNIGSALLPAINSIAKGLQPLIQGFAEFAAKNQGLVKVFAGIALAVAAIGPALMVIGGIVSAVGSIIAAWGAIQGAIAAATVAAASGTGIIGGLVATIAAIGAGPIIAGILAVAAGAFLIYKNWATIKEFFAGFADGFMAGIAPIVPTLQWAGEQIAMTFQIISQWLSSFFGQSEQAASGARNIGEAFGLMAAAVIGAVVNLPSNIMQIFGAIGAIISSWITSVRMFFVNIGLEIRMIFAQIGQTISMVFMQIQTAMMTIGMGIQTAMMGAIAGIQAAWSGLVGFFSGLWASITGAVQGAIAGIVGAIQGGAAQAVAAVQSMGAAMIGAIQGIAGSMFAAGVNIVNSIAQGIQSAAGTVVSAISSIAATIRGALPFSPPEWGPLSDIMKTGGNIVGSIAQGIQPGPILSAMQNALLPVQAQLTATGSGAGLSIPLPQPVTASAPAAAAGGMSGGITVNLTVNGGENAQVIGESLEEQLRALLPRLMNDLQRQRDRVAYS